MNTHKLILPANVSGFHDPEKPAPALMDMGRFIICCEKADEQGPYQLQQFVNFTPQATRSYHLAHFSGPDQLLVLCNKYFPLVAFAKVIAPSQGSLLDEIPENEYVDMPEMAVFFESDFQVLDTAYLGITVDADKPEEAKTVSKLCRTEFAEFSYWEPKVLADIVFNNWG